MKSLHRALLVLSVVFALIAITLGTGVFADDGYETQTKQDPFGPVSPLPPGIQINNAQVILIKEVIVPAEEAGVIETALVKEGDIVKEGDLLARISDSEVQLDRRKAQLEMEIAELRAKNDVSIRYARKSSEVLDAEWKRSKEAVARVKTAVSKTELDRQRLAVQKADLEIEQAQMDLDEQELNHQLKSNAYALATRAVERRQIRSPVAGKVVEVSKHRGEWVEPGNQVFRIVRIDRLRVTGDVNINLLLGDFEGRPVKFFLEIPGRPRLEFPGKLVFISPEVNEVNGQEVEVWAEIENKNNLLRPGMSGKLVIQNPEDAKATFWQLRNTLAGRLVGPHPPPLLAEEGDQALLRVIEAVDDVQHRRLAGAVRSGHRRPDFALPDISDTWRIARTPPNVRVMPPTASRTSPTGRSPRSGPHSAASRCSSTPKTSTSRILTSALIAPLRPSSKVTSVSMCWTVEPS